MESTQSVTDEDDYKAFNLGVVTKPTASPASRPASVVSRPSASGWHRPLRGAHERGARRLHRRRLGAAERGAIARHVPDSGPARVSHGWYSQGAYRFGSVRPFLRYQSVDGAVPTRSSAPSATAMARSPDPRRFQPFRGPQAAARTLARLGDRHHRARRRRQARLHVLTMLTRPLPVVVALILAARLAWPDAAAGDPAAEAPPPAMAVARSHLAVIVIRANPIASISRRELRESSSASRRPGSTAGGPRQRCASRVNPSARRRCG